ncbi:hypothetical protein [Nitratifractor sp.]
MQIVLITKNRIVREMLRIAAESVGAALTVVDAPAAIPPGEIDWIFVDDLDREACETLPDDPAAYTAETVCLHRESVAPPEGYDHYLAKPFLPADVVALLGERSGGSDEATQVLDAAEIETIRELLQKAEAEPEALTEETQEREEPEENAPRKETIRLEGEAFFEELARLKPKQLRKLLSGAEVTITIRFPEGEA